MVGDGSCVGDGGGAAAGLVGECAAGRALTQSQRKRRTGQTADGGYRSERIFEDRGEGLRDEADVDDDDAKCADNMPMPLTPPIRTMPQMAAAATVTTQAGIWKVRSSAVDMV